MKKIAVLMSSFNGEKYISDQIESIGNQFGDFEITIFVRDDGSSDRTVSIIESFNYDNIKLIRGHNVGVISSFLLLVEHVKNEKFDYYAFCDQDDIWLPLKLQTAVYFLTQFDESKDNLYCSAYDMVDTNLQHIARSQYLDNPKLENILIENCAPGCTMVFNRTLLNTLNCFDISKADSIIMHDWLAILIAKSSGNLILDNNSYIYYRQHSNNTVGVDNNKLKFLKKKIKYFLSSKYNYKLMNQANEVFALCGCKMSSTNKEKFEELMQISNDSFLKRLSLMRSLSLFRVKFFHNLIFKVFVLTGFYKNP